MPPLGDFLVIVAVIAVASLVHGYGGFGFGIVSMTLFAFLPYDLERMSVLICICGIVILGGLLVVSARESRVHWPKVGLIFAGVAMGQPFGYWFINTFSDRPIFRVSLGVVLVLFAGHGLFTPHIRRRLPLWLAWPIGIASGFIGGAFVSGGPPVILYLYTQADDPRDMKATVQAVFFAGLIYRTILASVIGGGFSGGIMALSAAAIPVSVGIMWLSHRLSRTGSVALFKRIVYSLIGAFGGVILVRGIIMVG